MNEDHNIIWNKISDLNTGKKFRKKFIKKSQQINKEKIIKHESNSIKTDANNNKALFINKKRGRKIKNSNDNKTGGIHDKFTDDNLKRKVKTHFHNYIIALLNSKIQYSSQDQKIKFGKMKSHITQNITVEYNRNLFEKKIKDIILEVSNKYQNKEINSTCYNYIMENKEINKEVIELLNMTYKDMYLDCYLKSTKQSFLGKEKDESFVRHQEKLKEKFGKEYLNKFIENAKNLINFYNTCKKRKSRKKNEGTSNIQSSKENTKQNKNINDNQSNYLDYSEIEKMYSEQNKISSITQTDAKPTCSESESENKNGY